VAVNHTSLIPSKAGQKQTGDIFMRVNSQPGSRKICDANDKLDWESVTGFLHFLLNTQAGVSVKCLNFMTLNLEKLLFPRLQPDQRRRELRFLLAALLTGLVIAGTVALVMLMVATGKLR
jgi:hypothetical protein